MTIPQPLLPIRAPIALTNERGTRIKKGMGMIEQPYDAAQEREEIAARVASFKAMQEKFQREREEYFVTTLENARSRHGSERLRFWS
jgi:chorismate mutase